MKRISLSQLSQSFQQEAQAACHTCNITSKEDDKSDQVNQLLCLCRNAREEDSETWTRILDWINSRRKHPELLRAAALTKGDLFGRLPLHMVCRERPPVEVVEALLEIAPETIGMKDRGGGGSLPLHAACNNGASLEVLELLVRRYPEGTVEGNFRGDSPLLLHVGNKYKPTTKDILHLFLDCDQDAPAIANAEGQLPLHKACYNGTSLEVIQELLRVFPQSKKEADQKQRTALHYALMNEHHPNTYDVVSLLLQHSVVSGPDEYGKQPLHHACENGAALKVLQLITTKYPNSHRTTDSRGRTPLHIAMEQSNRPVTLNTLRLLLDGSVATTANAAGQRILHNACTQGASFEIIQFIVQTNPMSRHAVDHDGRTPLHHALDTTNHAPTSVDIIKLLVDTETASIPDAQKMLPLHIACKYSASLEVLEILLQAWPHSRAVRDKQGWTPLRYTLQNNTATNPHTTATNAASDAAVVQILTDRHVSSTRDKEGLFPLHRACQTNASLPVLQVLLQSLPWPLEVKDYNGKTPLHYILDPTDECGCQCLVSKELVQLFMARFGNIDALDGEGKNPFHYACQKGVEVEILKILTEGNPYRYFERDHHGRTPLHFAMEGTHPHVIKYLLSGVGGNGRKLVNIPDKSGKLPLRLLKNGLPKEKANTNNNNNAKSKERDENNHGSRCCSHHHQQHVEKAKKCIDLYLQAKPEMSSSFFAAIRFLPEGLRDHAVVTESMQAIVNGILSGRIATMVLIFDFFLIVVVIAVFQLAILDMIDGLNTGGGGAQADCYKKKDSIATGVPVEYLVTLFFATSYFAMREVVQVVNLALVRLLRAYFLSPHNALDVLFILILVFWTSVMVHGCFPVDAFQFGTTMSTGVLFLKAFSFLRSTRVGFAVFAEGVAYVLKKLVIFLVSLGITLLAFAVMFHTAFRGTSDCHGVVEGGGVYMGDSAAPFCTMMGSLFQVFVMVIGEIDADQLQSNVTSKWLAAGFIFIVIIVLANILIAIVTDSYNVVRNERAQVLFWTNRLYFVAEVDLMKRVLQCDSREASDEWKELDIREMIKPSEVTTEQFGEKWWTLLVQGLPFQPRNKTSGKTVRRHSIVVSVIVVLLVIPVWFVLGLLSLGLLWPPQVRKFLLEQQILDKKNRRDAINMIQPCHLHTADKLRRTHEKSADYVSNVSTAARICAKELEVKLNTRMKSIEQKVEGKIVNLEEKIDMMTVQLDQIISLLQANRTKNKVPMVPDLPQDEKETKASMAKPRRRSWPR